LSNFHTGNSGSSNGVNGASGGSGSNGNSFVSRRDIRASNSTGALPVISAGRGYASFTGQPSSFDFEAMLVSLHELFEHDRQVASQQDARRCGICYLHYVFSELHYREEEGLYVCLGCDKAASKQQLPMVRRQQK
jgi:hypothetical protein